MLAPHRIVGETDTRMSQCQGALSGPKDTWILPRAWVWVVLWDQEMVGADWRLLRWVMGAEHHKLMLNTESSFKARSQMGRKNCRKADICPGRYSKTQGSHTVVTIKHCYSVFKRADLVLIRLHEMFLSPALPHVSNEKGSVVRFLNIFRNSNYGLRLYSPGSAWKHIFFVS